MLMQFSHPVQVKLTIHHCWISHNARALKPTQTPRWTDSTDSSHWSEVIVVGTEWFKCTKSNSSSILIPSTCFCSAVINYLLKAIVVLRLRCSTAFSHFESNRDKPIFWAWWKCWIDQVWSLRISQNAKRNTNQETLIYSVSFHRGPPFHHTTQVHAIEQ